MIVKVTAGLNPAVKIPGHGVVQSWFYVDCTHRANPDLASLCVLTGGELDRELDAALDFNF